MSSTKSNSSVKFNELNERFDKFTRENKIVRVFLPLLIFAVWFTAYEMGFSALYRYVQTGGFSILYSFDHVSKLAALSIACTLFLLPKTLQKIGFGITSVYWLIYGFAQLTVLNTTGALVRFVNVFTGKDAADFADSALADLPIQIYIFHGAMLILAVIGEVLLCKTAVFPKKQKYLYISKTLLICFPIVYLVTFLRFAPKDELSGDYFVYKNFSDNNAVYNMTEIYGYSLHDLRSVIMSDYSINSKEVIEDYFENKPAHAENDMTDVFKGKNLLIIQLESFDTDLITSGHCKNLKEIYDKSIVFDNYYGMRFGSEPTIGNEMAVNTGVYATTAVSASMGLEGFRFDNSLSKKFLASGYSTGVYHYNEPEFYHRDTNEIVFGYNSYTPLYTLTDKDEVFEDDAVAAENDDVYNALTTADGAFMHYFISYSCHAPYDFTQANLGMYTGIRRLSDLEERHPEYTVDKTDPDSVYRGYALLTDDMAGALTERMEKDGSLDNTVLLFVSDHACPHTMKEGSASNSDYLNAMQIPCFIYTHGITPAHITKTCANIDLLPTILNMFGIESDYRYIGNDIFDSTAEGIAYLPSLCWVTDKCKYADGTVTENFTDEPISDDYIKRITREVIERINVNNLLLYDGYYTHKAEENGAQ